MNLHVELSAWREALPLHLKFGRDLGRYNEHAWVATKWVKRQRQSVEVRKWPPFLIPRFA